MTGRATLDTVAAHAQVSRQTVSNVLNDPQVVRQDTRERVERSIAALGYRPNRAAQQLKTRRSRLIGLRIEPFAGGVSGSLLDQFLHQVSESAESLGYHVLLFTAQNDETEIAAYERLRVDAEIDGFVLTTTHYGDKRTAWLVRQGLPFITFGRPWGDEDLHSWVDVDGSAGTREATRHLLSLGHRRVAYLGWPKGSGTGDDRESGWRAAMGEAKLPVRGQVRRCRDDVVEAREAVRRMLEAADPPTAVVCASDVLALGAWSAAGEVTDRPLIAVIGFDNTAVVEALGLSSVAQPVAEAAQSCATLLAQQLGGNANGSHERVLLTPHLVTRASSIPPLQIAAGLT